MVGIVISYSLLNLLIVRCIILYPHYMTKNSTLLLSALAIVAVIGVFIAFEYSSIGVPQTAKIPVTAAMKITDAPYWPNAYLISEGNFDAQTQAALAGFTVTSADSPDGGKTITLKAVDPRYHDQTYALKPGQKLYFVEKSMGDDQNNQEYNLRDDWGVVTNSDGTIMQP